MQCPVCKADNEATETCRRCRADLRLLLEVESHQQHALVAAAAALRRGDLGEACECAEQAWALREDIPSLKMQSLVYLLQGDYARAFRLHARIR